MFSRLAPSDFFHEGKHSERQAISNEFGFDPTASGGGPPLAFLGLLGDAFDGFDHCVRILWIDNPCRARLSSCVFRPGLRG